MLLVELILRIPFNGHREWSWTFSFLLKLKEILLKMHILVSLFIKISFKNLKEKGDYERAVGSLRRGGEEDNKSTWRIRTNIMCFYSYTCLDVTINIILCLHVYVLKYVCVIWNHKGDYLGREEGPMRCGGWKRDAYEQGPMITAHENFSMKTFILCTTKLSIYLLHLAIA